MRLEFKALAVLFTLSVLAATGLADPPAQPITGSFTNLTTSITNGISPGTGRGDKWLLNSFLGGKFNGTNECSIEIEFRDQPRRYILRSNATVTNTLLFLDGDAGIRWRPNDILHYKSSAINTETNFFRIEYKVKQ